MNNSLSHTRLSAIAILVGILCLEGCSLYINFIWYEPKLLNGKDEVIEPKNNDSDTWDYEIWNYYTKTTANAWLIFFFPFIPLGQDYDGPRPSCHKGDLVIRIKKQDECPIVYINDNPVYGKIREDEPSDFIDVTKEHSLCHYGKIPIEDRQKYTIEYKGKKKRYIFFKNQVFGYIPIWFPNP